MSKHTPGPWRYETGYGHAYNRIVGSDIVQTNGWPEPINGVSNASYSERVCENLGDIALPGPAANVRLICAAPDLLEALTGLLAECNRHGCFEHVSFEYPTVKPFFDAARAAIAKATGEA